MVLDGSGWEAVGVAPHVKVEPKSALELARVRALEELAESGLESRRGEYRWHAETARAAFDPPKLTPEQLARYPGRYGEMTVALRDGQLFRQRPGQPDLPLRPLQADTFWVGPAEDTRLRFDSEGGRIVSATLLTRSGVLDTLRRAP
jgi:hypothetical protein